MVALRFHAIRATNLFCRRTYDDEDQGEDIRTGFEPTNVPAAESSDFAVGDDEDDEGAATSGQRSYEDLDDSNVWSRSPSKK